MACSNYLVDIANAAQPVNTFPGSSTFPGPYVYSGRLYSLSKYFYQDPITGNITESPQFWRSSDGGLSWVPLVLEITRDWYNYRWGVTAWNPSYGVNIVTFYHAGALIDFDLAAEMWGSAYATNAGYFSYPGTEALVRLPDGRLRMIYRHGDLSFWWATANAGGSGLWDSIDHAIPTGASSDAVTYSACPDSSNNFHALYHYVTTGTTAVTHVQYVHLSAANVLSTPVTLPMAAGELPSSSITAPGSQVYFATLAQNPADTNVNSLAINVWTGSNLTAPVWTFGQVIAYVFSNSNPSSPKPQGVLIGVVGGLITLLWTITHPLGLNGNEVHLTQTYGTEKIYVNFEQTPPKPPWQPRGGYPPWNGIAESFAAYTPGPAGMGVLASVLTQYPNRSAGNSAFFILPPCPPSHNNYVAMCNSLTAQTARYIA